jgi:hypothetical protein
MIRQDASELFAGLDREGGVLESAPRVVVPVALDGGVLTVFAHPRGTASRVDQRRDGLLQKLSQKALPVDKIVALDVSSA